MARGKANEVLEKVSRVRKGVCYVLCCHFSRMGELAGERSRGYVDSHLVISKAGLFALQARPPLFVLDDDLDRILAGRTRQSAIEAASAVLSGGGHLRLLAVGTHPCRLRQTGRLHGGWNGARHPTGLPDSRRHSTFKEVE